MKYGRGKNPNSRNGFKAGHKLNTGNQFAKGYRHTDEWKKQQSERLKGNSHGFKSGQESPRKGRKSNKPAWNKGLELLDRRGQNHPRWVKDRSKPKRQDRKDNPRYKEWRQCVWARDQFVCQMSSSECRGRIEAHHIFRWCEYPKLRYSINNGITLCQYHHPKKKAEEVRLQPLFHDLVIARSI